MNSPIEKKDTIAEALNDTTILAAIVISSVSCFIIFFIGIVIFLNRDSSSKGDIYTLYSDSSSTYLHPVRCDYGPSAGQGEQIYQPDLSMRREKYEISESGKNMKSYQYV